MEAFQAEVAWTALAVIGGHGFALAGAGALIAHGLVDRLTQDLDLFSPLPGGAAHVTGTLQRALEAAGFQVTLDSTHTVTGGDFARLEVHRGDRSVQIDLAGTGASTRRSRSPSARCCTSTTPSATRSAR